ncbi:MAG: OpgC domain-containing protein [Rhodospirillales bacterium]|nr:OpgC domain-containing protein [Rhodospirillales bacterium]
MSGNNRNRLTLVRTNRDLRVDFFRGLALWWIFTDHIPGNALGRVSLRNFTLSDATEVFVLLAGYGAALAYGRTLDRAGWLYSGADVVRRAWTLYVAHIFLFVLFAAQVGASAAALNRGAYLEEIHLDVLANAPYRALLDSLFLLFQPAYLNVLPLYIVLLLMFALVLPLLRRPALLFALSFGLYALTRLLHLNLPTAGGGGWFFNPLAWQLLFVLGALLAYAPPNIPLPPRLLDIAAAAVLLAGLLIARVVWPYPALAAHLPPWLLAWLLDVDKTGLHPYRFACILALLWAVHRLVPPRAAWLQSRLAAPFLLAGQHSLPVFCSGILLSFLGRLAMERSDGAAMQGFVNLAGGIGLLAVATIAAWYRAKGAASSRAGLPARAPSGTESS